MVVLQIMMGLAAAAQAAPEQVPPPAPAPEQVKAAAEPCPARQFETFVAIQVEGRTRRSRIRMCGTEGQSDADWIRTLKDGADKIAANETMTQDAKDQALAAIEAEIARLIAEQPQPPAQPATTLPAEAFVLTKPGASRALPEPGLAATYSALPPLEPKAPSTDRPFAAPVGASVPRVPLAKARLGLDCLTTADLGIGIGGPCRTIERDTILVVTAEEALAAGASLRLRRNGEVLSELALPAMAKGKDRRFKLPAKTCNGGFGRVEIEIARAPAGAPGVPQPIGSLGQYALRC